MNKAELRKLYLSKRSQLSEEEVETGSRKICDTIFKNFSFDNISSVHIFLPITSKSEINTFYIIERFKKEYPSVKIVVPKIEGDNVLSYLLTDNTVLEKNYLGVPEPVDGIVFEHRNLDFILMPLLAFDKHGNRIGYGKGFYDRFLTTCNPKAVKTGISLFEPEAKIEADAFDIPMNFCVTPEKMYSF